MSQNKEYKNVASVWLNASKDGNGCYLAIKNESNEQIVIEPGKSYYINMNTRMPIASKSVKVESQEATHRVDTDSIPF